MTCRYTKQNACHCSGWPTFKFKSQKISCQSSYMLQRLSKPSLLENLLACTQLHARSGHAHSGDVCRFQPTRSTTNKADAVPGRPCPPALLEDEAAALQDMKRCIEEYHDDSRCCIASETRLTQQAYMTSNAYIASLTCNGLHAVC